MKRTLGILVAAGLLASVASAQTIIAPVACELMNARTNAAAVGPWLENNPPVRWWDSSGIITNADLIADGAPVPGAWPQHEYGWSGVRTARVRDVNEDTLTPNGESTLTFDMGGRVNVDGIVLWNHGEFAGNPTPSDKSNRGIQTAAVSWSTNGVDFIDTFETLTFAQGPATNAPIDADDQYLAISLSEVTHVRLKVYNFNLGVISGFSEIRMIGERPYVPEFIADPIVKDDGLWGSDYASESQTLDGSATNSVGGTIYYEKVDGPDWLVVASNGTLSGIADVTGTNEFTIKAFTDADNATATLQIVVDPLGNPPMFTTNVIDKADGAYGEDYALQSQTLDGSATDPDGDTLSYFKAGGAGWLNVASNGALSGVCNVLGTNTFTVRVDDGNGNTDTASLVIFVQTVGNAPEFTMDPIIKADGAINKDYAFKSQTLEGSATDLDGDTLTYSKSGGPAWLNVATNGTLSGVCNIVDTNSFTVTVDDGNGNTDTATLLIYVAPKPFGELIVGMDAFDSTTAPTVTYMAAGISATATASGTGGDWSTTDNGTDPGRGSSVDTTWGTHVGPPAASAVTNAHGENFTLSNAKTDGEITFTIFNGGSKDLALGSFHMDALAFRPHAARTYTLSVLAGSSISTGVVFQSTEDAITQVAGNGALIASRDAHDDIDIFLDSLADNVLEPGGTAILQIAFSDGTGNGAGGHHLFVDNIGVALAGDLGSPESPELTITPSGSDVIISWYSDREFKLQTCTNLKIGNWVDYPGGDSSPVTVPATKAAEFMRLFWQE